VRRALAVAALVVGVAAAALAGAPPAAAPPLQQARVEEHLGATLPLDLTFRDADGRSVRLRDVVTGGPPVVLVLAWFRCPMLCGLVLDATARALHTLDANPTVPHARAVTVSIDPSDRPPAAHAMQARLLAARGRPGDTADWPFLVGDEPAIRALADAVGFRYARDPASGNFAHPAVVVVLTPAGRVASYVYGTDVPSAILAGALARAAGGRTTSPVDRILLRCFHYVPALRRWAGLVGGVLRVGGLLTLLALGAMFALLVRRARRREVAAP
jgi:protein SCO1/2